MSSWPEVSLGEVLMHRKEFVNIDDLVTYKRPRVKLHAQGIVLRDEVEGSLIKTKKQQVCRSGEFLVAEIDAKVGGFGIVPEELDGAIVSSHYFLFDSDDQKLDRRFLDWYAKTPAFQEQVAAQGSTNYAAIRPDHVLAYKIPLPPLPEQRRIVARIEELASKQRDASRLVRSVECDGAALLARVLGEVVAGATRAAMADVAPVVRRAVRIDPAGQYPELGIRSFGNGTFHKTPLSGLEVGTKHLFRIEPGDLVFNNVFAWEGAVAVAEACDSGRFGSHRFITCVPHRAMATAGFLRTWFLSPEGLNALGDASPGGAGRNRTLGVDKLMRMQIPVPAIKAQHWYDALRAKLDELKRLQAETQVELDALMPSILDRAFRGEL